VVAPIITVFGATGFLGLRIVRRLHEHGFTVRIASRHPSQAPERCSGPTIRDFGRSMLTFDPGNQWPMRSLAHAEW
jgi:nucleoside-diphosphate-sugar epimerase